MSAKNTDITIKDKVTPFAKLDGWNKSRITRMINTGRYVNCKCRNHICPPKETFDLTPDQIDVLIAYKAGKRITMYENPKIRQDFNLNFDSFYKNGYHGYYIHE